MGEDTFAWAEADRRLILLSERGTADWGALLYLRDHGNDMSVCFLWD
jgi:hypothetical protein